LRDIAYQSRVTTSHRRRRASPVADNVQWPTMFLPFTSGHFKAVFRDLRRVSKLINVEAPLRRPTVFLRANL